MSITYPEVQPAVTSKKAGAASIMNSGSALFPTGATGVYDRAAKARSGRKMPLAWIAAPVAVVLVGGAAYLAMTHHPAASPAPAVISVAKTKSAFTPAQVAVAPVPVASDAAPAVTAQATHVVHTQTTIRTTAPVQRRVPAARVTRSTTVPTHTVSSPAPVAIIPAPAPTNAAPTPGTFAFTPSATGDVTTGAVTTTPDTIKPPAAATPASSSDAQPAPQA